MEDAEDAKSESFQIWRDWDLHKSQKSFFKNLVFVILDSLLLLVVVKENNNYRKDI